MNPNCENCAAAPECPTACDYGSVFCTMKRLQSGQTKGKATNGFSLKDADDLRKYRAIGPPSDLIWPVRCEQCQCLEVNAKYSVDGVQIFEPYWCHELDRNVCTIGFCGYGVKMEQGNTDTGGGDGNNVQTQAHSGL